MLIPYKVHGFFPAFGMGLNSWLWFKKSTVNIKKRKQKMKRKQSLRMVKVAESQSKTKDIHELHNSHWPLVNFCTDSTSLISDCITVKYKATLTTFYYLLHIPKLIHCVTVYVTSSYVTSSYVMSRFMWCHLTSRFKWRLLMSHHDLSDVILCHVMIYVTSSYVTSWFMWRHITSRNDLRAYSPWVSLCQI